MLLHECVILITTGLALTERSEASARSKAPASAVFRVATGTVLTSGLRSVDELLQNCRLTECSVYPAAAAAA